MKTLKQLFSLKHKIIHASNPIYMTENDYIECFKEWLTQKRLPELKMNFPSNGTTAINRFINELLEELNNE